MQVTTSIHIPPPCRNWAVDLILFSVIPNFSLSHWLSASMRYDIEFIIRYVAIIWYGRLSVIILWFAIWVLQCSMSWAVLSYVASVMLVMLRLIFL